MSRVYVPNKWAMFYKCRGCGEHFEVVIDQTETHPNGQLEVMQSLLLRSQPKLHKCRHVSGGLDWTGLGDPVRFHRVQDYSA